MPTPNFLPSQTAAITVSEYVIFVEAGPDMEVMFQDVQKEEYNMQRINLI